MPSDIIVKLKVQREHTLSYFLFFLFFHFFFFPSVFLKIYLMGNASVNELTKTIVRLRTGRYLISGGLKRHKSASRTLTCLNSEVCI